MKLGETPGPYRVLAKLGEGGDQLIVLADSGSIMRPARQASSNCRSSGRAEVQT
jgi:hypothetical protein